MEKNSRGKGKKKTVQKIASLAQKVIEKAKQGNPLAITIVEESCEHLSELVLEVAENLKVRGVVSIGWAGGLFRSPYFRRKFMNALKETFKNRRFEIVRPYKFEISPKDAERMVKISKNQGGFLTKK